MKKIEDNSYTVREETWFYELNATFNTHCDDMEKDGWKYVGGCAVVGGIQAVYEKTFH